MTMNLNFLASLQIAVITCKVLYQHQLFLTILYSFLVFGLLTLTRCPDVCTILQVGSL